MSTDFALSDILVSKVIPYYMIPYGLGALIYAPLTRFFSFRRVLGVSMFFYALSCWMCASAETLNQLLLARIAMGISGAGAIPLGLMIIGQSYEKQIRGRLVGLFFSFSFFASLAGLALSGLAHWRWLFYCPAGFAAIMFIFCLFIKSETFQSRHLGRINYLAVLKKAEVFRVFLFIFALSALYHGVHKWFGVYLSQEYQLQKGAISLLFILAAIGGFVGQLLGGQLSDKKGRLFACYVGLLGLGTAVVLLVGTYPIVILAMLLCGVSIFWTIGHNGISTVLTDFKESDRPVIASLNSSVRFVSGGVGFVVSRIFVKMSFGWTFFGIGILMLALAMVLKAVVGEKKGI